MSKQYKKYNFNSRFEAHGYPESAWPLLNDYLSRCASEFDLSAREVEQRLNIMLNNLDTIEIDNNPDTSTNACYYPKSKKISLNYAGMSKRNESYLAHLCSMFHELNHVCENMDSKDSTSFMEKNPRTGRLKGVSFNEVLTEMKAARLTMNLRLSADMGPGYDPKCMTRHFGYNDLMFVGTMVQTTLGLSEKEFLTAADKGPEHFREVMSKKFPNSADYDIFMARVTFFADSIHAIKYANTDTPLTKEEMNNITNLTASLYKECLITMNIRLSAEAERGDIDPETFSEKSRYEVERLTANYEHAIRLNTPYKPEQLKPTPALGDLQSKILAIEAVNASREKLGRKKHEKLLEELASIDTDPTTLLAKHGVAMPSIQSFNKTDISDYKRDFLTDDYGDEQWDNKNCLGAIKAMEHDAELQPRRAKVLEFRPRGKTSFIDDLTRKVASSDTRSTQDVEMPEENTMSMPDREQEQAPEL